ncbi:START domain-containing protein 10 [Podila epigama]|nr:START domain-containing protein 10 [Podila epigama]
MAGTSKSPLAMLVLLTPYTILYLVNQSNPISLSSNNIHYVFFELIFVLAFRKVFNLPDLSEKLFPAQVQVSSGASSSSHSSSARSINPAKTNLVTEKSFKKKSKKPSSSTTTPTTSATAVSTTTTTTTTTPVTTSSPTARKRNTLKKEVPYAREMAAMETKFFDYINNTEIWEKVFEEHSPELIQVYQFKERPMCYKVIAVMNNTPAVTFDLLSDITRRIEWDPLCVEAKTIADIGPGTKIQYVRTKGMWPTASRDTLVLGSVKDLGQGTYCNITTGVEHPAMPERIKEKFVRMETAVAGQIIGPEPGFPNKARLVQVLDADLKGWIPEKVIQMVSTKAVPEGMRNVNKLIPTIEPYSESKIMKQVTVARLEAEAAAHGDNDNENDNDDNSDGNHQDGETSLESTHALKNRMLLSDHRQAVLLSGQSTDDHQHRHHHHHHHDHHRHHQDGNNQSDNREGRLERRKKPSTYRALWEGMKQNLGLGGNAMAADAKRANKIMVMTLFLAVVGPTISRWRRNRRK